MELIVDNFAGGGGASTGIEAALKRPVNIAINHDKLAIEMHKINHPQTTHYCESVWDINPVKVCNGQKVGLAWFSPDCKHFSKAKGGRPIDKNIRGLAWVALKWAATVKPRIIILENVEEFSTWCPLKNNRPDMAQKGRTFNCFINALTRHGYNIDWRVLTAADYGTPTIRQRLFIIARCDGLPISWPAPSHAKPDSKEVANGVRKPWLTAASIIDHTIPCPSIFTRKRPLAEKTLKRIARGLEKYVFSSKSTSAFLTEFANGSNYRNMDIESPLRTICAEVKGGHFALVKSFISRQFGNSVGHDLNIPLGTITAGGGGKSLLIKTFLTQYYGTGQTRSLSMPLGTITTRDRFALVQIHGNVYQISDIGLRMLSPRELFRAQGFADSYIIDHGASGCKLTKTEQVQKCGNSVCPPVAEAIVKHLYKGDEKQ